ncbi:MAG: 3-dehydroquinate synthase [Chthoniobacterales bacterium]
MSGTSFEVRTGRGDYRVLIGSGVADRAGELISQLLPQRSCAIVADSNVAGLFAERLEAGLATAGFQPALIIIPPGETSKTLEQAAAVCDQMIASGLDRQSFVIGLGGGVVGDLSGFVGAIFHRGIPHVQIPTTLLAMVDSSIGGKTGVNTNAGKNLLGAIHLPSLVIDDVDLLQTLPPRHFRQGFAEIVKHAVIADAEMFERVGQASGLSGASGTHALQSLIHRNVEIKAKIVAGDELDRTGERALLNFGHTVGHAIERAGNYKDFLHGEAISLGMAAACTISMKRAGLPRAQRDAIVDLLNTFELPTRLPPDFPRDKIFAGLKLDKKFERGEVRFVVTPKIGSAYLSRDVTLEDIREAVEQL